MNIIKNTKILIEIDALDMGTINIKIINGEDKSALEGDPAVVCGLAECRISEIFNNIKTIMKNNNEEQLREISKRFYKSIL